MKLAMAVLFAGLALPSHAWSQSDLESSYYFRYKAPLSSSSIQPPVDEDDDEETPSGEFALSLPDAGYPAGRVLFEPEVAGLTGIETRFNIYHRWPTSDLGVDRDTGEISGNLPFGTHFIRLQVWDDGRTLISRHSTPEVWARIRGTSTDPLNLTFGDQAGLEPEAVVTSSIVPVTAITSPEQLTLSNISGSGFARYRVCWDAACQYVRSDWSDQPSNVENGEFIQLRMAATDTFANERILGVTIGSVTGQWTALTREGVSGPFQSITRDGGSTCAIDREGRGWCWGVGDSHRLGKGTTSRSPVPTLIADDHRWAKISLGTFHGCGITLSGEALCWGTANRPQVGALGDGATTDSVRMRPYPTRGDYRYDDLFVGGSSACAIQTNGIWRCWGDNAYGQIQPSGGNYGSPTTNSYNYIAYSHGRQHSCGIDSDQVAWCWGHHQNGNIGDGQTYPQWHYNNVRKRVSGHRFKQISASPSSSAHFTCGVNVDGIGYCWGPWARLGIGESSGNHSTPQRVAGNVEFSKIATGSNQTCGLDTSGAAWCWGWNTQGALGTNDANEAWVYEPKRVVGGHVFDDIVSGTNGSCALKQSVGEVWCWGDGRSGQIGDDNLESAFEPRRVNDPLG